MERPDTIDLETATRDTIEEVSKIFSIGCPCDGEIGQKIFQVTMTFFASCVSTEIFLQSMSRLALGILLV